MKKILVISDQSKFIFFKNRKVRTPVELHITDGEMDSLQVELKMRGIQNWKVKDVDDIKHPIKKNSPATILKVNIPEVEKIPSTNTTTLERLMKEE